MKKSKKKPKEKEDIIEVPRDVWRNMKILLGGNTYEIKGKKKQELDTSENRT